MRRHTHGLALIIRGTVGRLGVHAGLIPTWRKLKLPIPDLIIGTSAGAIIGLSALGWNDKSDEQMKEVVGNLKRDDICIFEPKVKLSIKTLIGALLFILFVLYINHLMVLWVALLVDTIALAILLKTGAFFRTQIQGMKAPFSTEPLRHLLHEKIDFRALKSPIELRVLATDILNSGSVSFSTKTDPHTNPDNPEDCGHWVEILRASSALLFFEPITLDGKLLGDGEFTTDLPIEMVRPYRHVVVLDYWPGTGLKPAKQPSSFIEYVSRVYDLMRDIGNLNKEIAFSYESHFNPELPELYFLRASPELMKKAPNINLLNLGPEKLREAIKFGEELMEEQAPKLREYLKT